MRRREEMLARWDRLDWRERCRTLEAVAAYGVAARTLIGSGEPERVECGEVSASFFPLLGAQPRIGRNFTEAEDKSGGVGSECLLLAGAGGAAGLLLAYWSVKLLGSLNSIDAIGDLARLSTITIDLRALGFTLLVSLLTGLFCCLLPALQFSRPDLNTSLKEGARGGGFHGQGARRSKNFSSPLVVPPNSH